LGSIFLLIYSWRKGEDYSFFMLPIIRAKGSKDYSTLHIWPIFSLIKDKVNSSTGVYFIYPFFGLNKSVDKFEIFFPW
jgi:hypothetical protein